MSGGAASPAATAGMQVLFVCMGNICRSPTAHGVLRRKVADAGLAGQIRVDSAGTHGHYHAGEAPDARSQAHARRRGYELADLRARQLQAADFETADLLLVMDDANLAWVLQRCAPQQRTKVRRLGEFCRARSLLEVPDPYHDGVAAFEHVLDLVEDACDGLIDRLRAQIERRPQEPDQQVSRSE
jgi:protein-tyrosine phosphatase